jgi:MHS family alpha-ketoglutarate permease-like MFS transporter
MPASPRPGHTSGAPSAEPSTRRSLLPGIAPEQLRAAGIGQVVEWFDWTAYALLALYFSNQFFPEESGGLVALLGTFGIMAVGFVVRPISGLLVGAIADHFGRKPALLLTVWGMGASSLVIALVPTYEQIGILAPLILLIARMVQGISIGGEFSSMSAFAMEQAGPGKRGWVAGLIVAFGQLGTALVVLVVTVLSFALSLEAMQTWGWRVVFGIGALLALLGLVLRRDMVDTVDTTKIDRRVTLASVFEPMTRHPKQTIRVIGLTIGFTAMVYAWGTYFPTYAATYEGLALKWPLLSLFVTSIAMVLITPLAGLVTDRFGRKPVLITAGVLLTAGTVPALALLTDSIVRLIIIQLFGNAVLALVQAAAMPAYAELFPKAFRAAGFGFPYSLTVGVVGGSVPLIGTQFVSAGMPQLFPWYLVILMGISTLFYIGMRETGFTPLPE